MPLPLADRRLLAILILTAGSAAACSDSATGPTTTPPQTLTLVCPGPQAVASTSGLPIAVAFTVPKASGGTAPVTTTCTPTSGFNFPIGSTVVTCNAVDAQQHAASCSFNVTVAAPPRTAVTRYVTYGDSITEGFPHTIAPQLVDPAPDNSYPAVLLALMRARYTAQTITVLDEGVGGEFIGTGLARLGGVLSTDAPGALLLMEGANDLNQYGADAISPGVSGLRTMVRLARGSGIVVFVGTLLPEFANGTPARAAHPEQVVPFNDAIKTMAAAEGAVLVDLYAAFGGVADPTLISSDGLHPTAAGNQRIAQTFFDAVKTRLEVVGSGPARRTR